MKNCPTKWTRNQILSFAESFPRSKIKKFEASMNKMETKIGLMKEEFEESNQITPGEDTFFQRLPSARSSYNELLARLPEEPKEKSVKREKSQDIKMKNDKSESLNINKSWHFSSIKQTTKAEKKKKKEVKEKKQTKVSKW
jgi:hypothetical protein